MVGTNSTKPKKAQTPDLIGEEADENDDEVPAPALAPKKVVKKSKPSTAANKS